MWCPNKILQTLGMLNQAWEYFTKTNIISKTRHVSIRNNIILILLHNYILFCKLQQRSSWSIVSDMVGDTRSEVRGEKCFMFYLWDILGYCLILWGWRDLRTVSVSQSPTVSEWPPAWNHRDRAISPYFPPAGILRMVSHII